MANITTTNNRNYFGLTLFAVFLAFCVIMLGAYTRLKDAGLGCPDWPGCYGQLTVPHTQTEITQATKLFPAQPVEAPKAWAEMVHRYFAGTLGIIIFVLTLWALFRYAKHRDQPLFLPILLSLLVIFQAALGMWTVTWKLLPLVVMGHLLGGMTVISLLWALALITGKLFPNQNPPLISLRPWAIIGLIIVALQIFLGGWTSSNYASVACTTFPFCQGSFFPTMEIKHAFNFFSPVGNNYQGGLLDMTARITIHMFHRYGGVIVGLYIGILSLYLIISKKAQDLRALGWIMLILLLLQVTLGILNVELKLPIEVAVAHNGGAALLLLSVVTLTYKLYTQPRRLSGGNV